MGFGDVNPNKQGRLDLNWHPIYGTWDYKTKNCLQKAFTFKKPGIPGYLSFLSSCGKLNLGMGPPLVFFLHWTLELKTESSQGQVCFGNFTHLYLSSQKCDLSIWGLFICSQSQESEFEVCSHNLCRNDCWYKLRVRFSSNHYTITNDNNLLTIEKSFGSWWYITLSYVRERQIMSEDQ